MKMLYTVHFGGSVFVLSPSYVEQNRFVVAAVLLRYI